MNDSLVTAGAATPSVQNASSMETKVPATASTNPALTTEEIRLLAEIGFLACGAGHTRAARLLFEGLRNLRPTQPFAYIGLALSRLEAGENEEAIRILREEGLRNNPDNDEVKVFLGLALATARRASESQRVLSEVADPAKGDVPEARFARRLLGKAASPQGSTGAEAQGEHDGT